MRLRYLTAGYDFPGINRFLESSDFTLIYQSPNFMKHLSFHLGCKVQYLIALDKLDNIVGLLPFATSEKKTGTVVNSLPFYGSNGGPITHRSDLEIASELILNLTEIFANSQNPLSLTVIENPLDNAVLEYDKLGFTGQKDSRISQFTHLKGIKSDNQLLNSFLEPRARNIRTAIKKGVTSRSSHNLDDLQFLHEAHCENISSIGGKVKDRNFFMSIPSFFPSEQWRIYIAEINNRPVAGLLIFKFNKTVEYFTPVTISEFKNTQALSLLIYKAMLESIKDGMTYWNWGGTWHSQKGVYDFKKRWNTVESIYTYHTIINPRIKEFELTTLQDQHKGFYLFPY